MASYKLVNKIVVLTLMYIVIRQVKTTRIDNPDLNETSNARIIYDQRQNGKYNIHVVIKDVAIIEIDQNEISDQNYNDDEYYYDEDDLTVKPLKPTTTSIKPLYSTTSTTTSQTTVYSTKSQNSATGLSSTFQDMATTFSLSPLLSTLTPTTETHDTLTDDEHTNAYLPLNVHDVDIKSRSKIEPIYAYEEKRIIHPQMQSRKAIYPSKESTKSLTNSNIFKLKIHRSHRSQRQHTKRCHSYQYKNSEGNCLENRSSTGSIIKRLLSMLVTLPFTREQHHSDN